MNWRELQSEFLQLLDEGGLALWFIILLGVILFSVIITSWIRLGRVVPLLKENVSDSDKLEVIEADYALFELDVLAPVKRRLPVIQVLVGAAPLAGLLGTVSGMLVTFSGMASVSAIKPIDSIALGVSKALITTQIGLLLAIPGALLLSMLTAKINQLELELEQRLSDRRKAILV